mgnify:CR=1 FL=1
MAKPVLKEGVSPYPYHKGVNKLMETLKNKNSYDSAVESLDDRVQKVLLYLPSMMKDHISEVRLREGQPLAVQMGDRTCFVSCQSKLTDTPTSMRSGRGTFRLRAGTGPGWGEAPSWKKTGSPTCGRSPPSTCGSPGISGAVPTSWWSGYSAGGCRVY